MSAELYHNYLMSVQFIYFFIANIWPKCLQIFYMLSFLILCNSYRWIHLEIWCDINLKQWKRKINENPNWAKIRITFICYLGFYYIVQYRKVLSNDWKSIRIDGKRWEMLLHFTASFSTRKHVCFAAQMSLLRSYSIKNQIGQRITE